MSVKEVVGPSRGEMDSRALRLAQFLDDFRHEKKDPFSLIAERPPKSGDIVFDARLAATVEALCDEIDLEPPEWVWDEVYTLKEPVWALDVTKPEARRYFEETSMPQFAKRNMFFGDNVISRV